MLDRHAGALAEGEEFLQDASGRRVDAQFQVAQGAAADAGTARQFQACQAQALAPNGDEDARQRRSRFGAAGALAQMGVPQGMPFQKVVGMANLGGHRRLSPNRGAGRGSAGRCGREPQAAQR